MKLNNNETFKVYIEMTDTYGGEANYSWVDRYEIDMPINSSDRQIVMKSKEVLGLTGVKCYNQSYGDMIKLKLVNACIVVFITFDN